MHIEIPQVNNTKESVPLETVNNCIIIIGANGSGKSRFAAYIEKKDYEKDRKGANILRISAQRILNFGHTIPMKSYTRAEMFVQYGNGNYLDKGQYKWRDNDGGEDGWTTAVNNDYNDVLAAFIAKINLDNQKGIESLKVGKTREEVLNNDFIIDKLKRIWSDVLPERNINIVLETASVIAFMDHNGQGKQEDIQKQYNAAGMSDGERVCLYMICQVLCAPQDIWIIIDEPELHLHPSIMHRLWADLEQARPDCHFIYVTHDTDFAAQHGEADIIWIKSFDGENWDYEKLKSDNLPDSLLLSILGNRKNVLFVEGKEGGLDYQLYSRVFRKSLVIPCGSCINVIERVKAYGQSPYLHHLKVAGLIDRDYRTQHEIDGLMKENVYCLKVAEVENLFLTQEVLTYYQKKMALPEEILSVIYRKGMEHFRSDLTKQISNALKSDLRYHLSVTDIMGKETEPARIKENLETDLAVFINKFWAEESRRYQEIADKEDFEEVLMVYNRKSLYSILREASDELKKEGCSDIDKNVFNDYKHSIMRELKLGNSDTIVSLLEKYIPKELLAMQL